MRVGRGGTFSKKSRTNSCCHLSRLRRYDGDNEQSSDVAIGSEQDPIRYTSQYGGGETRKNEVKNSETRPDVRRAPARRQWQSYNYTEGRIQIKPCRRWGRHLRHKCRWDGCKIWYAPWRWSPQSQPRHSDCSHLQQNRYNSLDRRKRQATAGKSRLHLNAPARVLFTVWSHRDVHQL